MSDTQVNRRQGRKSNQRNEAGRGFDPLQALVDKSRGARRDNSNRPVQVNSRSTHLPSVYAWEADGVDHINFCSGTSSLSALLAMRNGLPFTHSYAGRFRTVEGFSFFIQSMSDDDFFRDGHPSKFRKRLDNEDGLRQVYDSQVMILDAMYQKIIAYPDLANAVASTDLPFDFYYEQSIEGGDKVNRVRPSSYDWRIRGMNYIREHLRTGVRPSFFEFMRPDTRDQLDWGKLNASNTRGEAARKLKHELELQLLDEVLADRFGYMRIPKPTLPPAQEAAAPAEAPQTPAVIDPTVDVPATSVPVQVTDTVGISQTQGTLEPQSTGESPQPPESSEPFVAAVDPTVDKPV